ncbi:MAG: AAA domain-containing protein [Thiotrichales bacterium]|nr:AAA domain-containing protein [Thiotrichales bacterium]MBT7473745.1 AAA domain-containing protein [Nitrosopumilus sp.]
MSKESSAINPASLEYIQVTPEDHYVREVPAYHEIRNEFKIYDGLLASRKPLLIQGPKGIGKTLSIAKWVSSKKTKMPFIQYDCSEGTKESNLVGRSIIHKSGTTPFKLGVIPTAIELANKAKIAVLCLEEVGSLAPAMQKLLNPLLDWRSGMYVDALDKIFHLEKDAKLIVFATSNPSNNGGIYELNQDLKSRFAIWNWNYPETKDEMSMVNLTDIPKEFSKGIFLLAMETRALEKNGSLDYAISTRDISDAFHLYRSYKSVKGISAEQLVLDLKILGNYDAEDQIDTIKSRIESIFGKEMFDTSKKTQ